jgi:hypothetical protein
MCAFAIHLDRSKAENRDRFSRFADIDVSGFSHEGADQKSKPEVLPTHSLLINSDVYLATRQSLMSIVDSSLQTNEMTRYELIFIQIQL